MRSGILPLALLTLGLLLSGCTQTAVVLWTDVAELVPAVELFNVSQEDHIVELVYEPELASALRLARTPPDLVIGKSIADHATVQLLQPLDRFVRREIDADAFYAGLLAAGARNGRRYLLPVAFNLPLVYFGGARPEVGTPIIISPQEMRARADGFNAETDGQWTRIAYSPIWNPAFLYQYMRVLGFQVRESENGSPEWSFQALLGGVSDARAWIETHGGLDADRAFQTKYLYDPQIELVRRGRVAYGYMASDRYFSLSDARRDGLSHRWLGTDGSVAVLERVVYAGIPSGAKSRRGAERFLAGLFSVEQQLAIMESTIRKRVGSFGIAGGFSSLWRVTERHFPHLYPELAGRIPPASWLHFPPAVPRHWSSLVPEVVEPWLVREISGTPQARDLEGSVRAWLLQQEY